MSVLFDHFELPMMRIIVQALRPVVLFGAPFLVVYVIVQFQRTVCRHTPIRKSEDKHVNPIPPPPRAAAHCQRRSRRDEEERAEYQQAQQLRQVQLERFCAKLRANDPVVTEVNAMGYTAVNGGAQLGRALRHNNQVTCLTVGPSLACVDDPNAQLELDRQSILGDWLQFVHHSTSLRSLTLSTSFGQLRDDFGSLTATATSNDVDTRAAAAASMEWWVDTRAAAAASMEWWVDAVAANCQLQELNYHHAAAASKGWDNSSNVVLQSSLLRLLETTQSPLQSLIVPAWRVVNNNNDNTSTATPNAFANAIQNIGTLERLHIYGLDCVRLQETRTLLEHYMPCPSRLSSLTLSFTFGTLMPLSISQAVALYLQKAAAAAATTTTSTAKSLLTCFTLAQYTFDRLGMGCLLPALLHIKSLSHLSLLRCKFTPLSLATLFNYMQTINRACGNIKSLVLDLSFWSVQFFPPLTWLMTGCGLEALEVYLDKSNARQCFLDKHWESFVVHQSPQFSSFKVDLPFEKNVGEYVGLLRHLPNILYLRSLQVSCPNWDKPPKGEIRKFCRAVKSNPSLYAVKFTNRSRTSTGSSCGSSMLSARQARLVEAYGQRNRYLPRLLSAAAVEDDRAGGDSISPGNSRASSTAPSSTASSFEHDDNRTNGAASCTLQAVPALGVVALQTPRTSAQNLLRGFLARHHEIGSSAEPVLSQLQ